jgi:hypothetical protein
LLSGFTSAFAEAGNIGDFSFFFRYVSASGARVGSSGEGTRVVPLSEL